MTEKNGLMDYFLGFFFLIIMLVLISLSTEKIEIQWFDTFSALYGISSPILYFLIKIKILSGFRTSYIEKYEISAYLFIFILLFSSFSIQFLKSVFQFEIKSPWVDLIIIIGHIIMISIIPLRYLETKHGIPQSVRKNLDSGKMGYPTQKQYGILEIFETGAKIFVIYPIVTLLILLTSFIFPEFIDKLVSTTFAISFLLLYPLWDKLRKS